MKRYVPRKESDGTLNMHKDGCDIWAPCRRGFVRRALGFRVIKGSGQLRLQGLGPEVVLGSRIQKFKDVQLGWPGLCVLLLVQEFQGGSQVQFSAQTARLASGRDPKQRLLLEQGMVWGLRGPG